MQQSIMKNVQLTDPSFPQQILSKFEFCPHPPFRTEGTAFGAVVG
jgi:hypothetical protein